MTVKLLAPFGAVRGVDAARYSGLAALGAALVAVAVSLVAGACSATAAPTHHILFVAQSSVGVGDGSSCADARDVAFFNAASSWGVGKAIAPGVTVGLCGTISSTLTVQGSGSAGSPITILFEPGARISQPVSSALVLSGRSYITVDGGSDGVIEATDNGTLLGHQTPSTAIVANPCDNCEIKNLTIRNVYVISGADRSDPIDNSGERCVYFSGSNWQIHDNTLHDASWCLFNAARPGDTGIHVYNNEIYNVDHGYILSGGNGSTIGDVWFNNNHVHDLALWAACASCHHDGVHCYSSGTAGMHIGNLYIYDNRFDGDPGLHMTSWVFLEGTAQGTACNDATSNIWIFNNRAVSSGHITTNDPIVASNGNVLFANNTIDGPDPTNPSSTCLGVIATGTYVNNAIGGCNQLVHGASNPAQLDYNAYAHCTGSTNCFSIGPSSGWTSTFTSYRSSFSNLDSHSTADLTADTGSNTAGIGQNLNTLCTGNLTPLCTDINGNTRPLRMAPDAGAVQAESALISPGSIGRVRLRTLRTTVSEQYGPGRRLAPAATFLRGFGIYAGERRAYRTRFGTLVVAYTSAGKVAGVATTSPYYSTAAGIGAGAAIAVPQLRRQGWRSCGRLLVRRRGHNVTKVRAANGRITAIAVADRASVRC